MKIYYCVSGGELLQPRFRSCCWLCQTGEAEDYIAKQVGCVYIHIYVRIAYLCVLCICAYCGIAYAYTCVLCMCAGHCSALFEN